MYACFQDGTVVHFKIKKNTPLRKLMTAYCERQGFQRSSIRFVFDGTPVGEEQTPLEVNQSLLKHVNYQFILINS